MALFDREHQLIQILDSLARTGNISQTASELFMTQPTVSKIIRTQEKEFGCEFIDRTAHPLKLTYAGEFYLNKIRTLAQEYQTLSHNLQAYASTTHGRVAVGINPSLAQVVLPRILPDYHRQYPQIEIQLREQPADQLQAAIQNGDLDVYIGVTPAYNAALTVQHLYSDTGMLMLPRRLAPSSLPDTPLEDISSLVNGRDFIVETQSSDFQRTVDSYLTKYNVTPNVVLQTANLTTACTLACAGLGATILPHSIPEALIADQDVVCLPLAPSVFSTEVALAYNHERHLSASAQAFIDATRAVFHE